jgi:hypothetical protein
MKTQSLFDGSTAWKVSNSKKRYLRIDLLVLKIRQIKQLISFHFIPFLHTSLLHKTARSATQNKITTRGKPVYIISVYLSLIKKRSLFAEDAEM